MAIKIGPDDLLYVANRASPLTICTKGGDYVDRIGGRGEGDGQFMWVTDIAFNRRGELAISDEHAPSQRISMFEKDGRFLRHFGVHGNREGQMDRPSGIAFGPDDNLYVVDSLNNRVQVFTSTGQYLARWGTYGNRNGEFDMPWGITIDREGQVFVTDWRNDRVQKFSPDGKFLMAFGHSGSGEGELNRPNGITVDDVGDIYVCDWMNDRVQIFDANGGFKDILIGHSGVSKWARGYLDANPGVEEKLDMATHNIESRMRFYRPVSVQVDEFGKVFVADCYRHRVQVYQKIDE
jgi:DNA-binding beta-propeller fold protein YncE